MHTRREFLALGLGAAALLRSQDSLSCGASTHGATLYVPPSSPAVPRLRMSDFVTTDAWPQFVEANQALRTSNPFQAGGPSLFQILGGWHQICCTETPDVHGTIYFLPWHRLVVHLYERALRHVSNNPNLTVPYWRWQTDFGVPAAYDSTPALYALNEANQVVPRNTELQSSLWNPSAVDTDSLLGESQFETFCTTSDQNAHIFVHIVSGPVMFDLKSAARDPLFYAHHANMDRVWFQWKQLHPGPCPAGIADNRIYFNDLDGSPKYTTIGALWDETALGYSYPAPSNQPKMRDFLRFEGIDLRRFHLKHHEIVCFAIRLKAGGAFVASPTVQITDHQGSRFSFTAPLTDPRALAPHAQFTITRLKANLDPDGAPQPLRFKSVKAVNINVPA